MFMFFVSRWHQKRIPPPNLTHDIHHLHFQNVVSEAARKKERDMVTREIERLRSSIQTVCRSTLPLGKIMDYIQEDMDAMQAELNTWRRENKEHAQALLQEQRWGWHRHNTLEVMYRLQFSCNSASFFFFSWSL